LRAARATEEYVITAGIVGSFKWLYTGMCVGVIIIMLIVDNHTE
jgi:hypothetical protein